LAAYYAAIRGRPPRPTLLRACHAMRRVPGRRAIDLGCGSGRDTLPMLAEGWHVWALDAEPRAIAELEAAVPAARRPRLVTRIARFETAHLPGADLVNASFSLIAIERYAVLADLVRRIHAALRPNGRFAGQLLGCRDSWVAAGRGVVGLDRTALATLLCDFRLERVDEEETDSVTPLGEVKHWHIWHIDAVKRRAPLRARFKSFHAVS